MRCAILRAYASLCVVTMNCNFFHAWEERVIPALPLKTRCHAPLSLGPLAGLSITDLDCLPGCVCLCVCAPVCLMERVKAGGFVRVGGGQRGEERPI